MDAKQNIPGMNLGMDGNPAIRKRNFLPICEWREKSSEAEILEQQKPQARGVLWHIKRLIMPADDIYLTCQQGPGIWRTGRMYPVARKEWQWGETQVHIRRSRGWKGKWPEVTPIGAGEN